jgi:hypothetical protein
MVAEPPVARDCLLVVQRPLQVPLASDRLASPMRAKASPL